MPNPQYQVRLPNDTATGIEQYTDDHGVTKSEVLRSAVKEYLHERGYPKLEADGGAPAWARPVLVATGYRFALYSLVASLAAAFFVVANADALLRLAAYSVALGGLVSALVLLAVLLTPLPELVDQHVARRVWRLRYPEVASA